MLVCGVPAINRIQLTPVAIHEGAAVADTMFASPRPRNNGAAEFYLLAWYSIWQSPQVLVSSRGGFWLGEITLRKFCPKIRDSIFYLGFKPRDTIFPAALKENSIFIEPSTKFISKKNSSARPISFSPFQNPHF